MPVQRYHCEQLPRIAILRIDPPQPSMLKTYLVHAEKTVAYLQGVPSGRSSRVMSTLFTNTNTIKDGGYLDTALLEGELKASHYTHYLKRPCGVASNPSRFLTLDGVQALLEGLPKQDPTARQTLQQLFERFCSQERVFEPATQEQCAKHEEDIEELFTAGCSPEATMDLVPAMQMQFFFDKRCLELQLRTEHEMAELREKLSATQIQQLKDKLEYTETTKNAEIARLKELQPAPAKRPRLACASRKPPSDSFFVHEMMNNVAQPEGGWLFKELQEDNEDSVPIKAVTAAPKLIIPPTATNTSLYRAFSVKYTGKTITPSHLRSFPEIKEAYGTMDDQHQYIVVVLYSRARMLSADIMSRAIKLCPSARSVAVYNNANPILDHALTAMLNTPKRWIHFASSK